MIAIIDYDAGNLASVFRAVSHLGFSCAITKDVHEIKAAERIIFPGVGAQDWMLSSKKHLPRGNPFWVFAWAHKLF
jgi:glutamine amidotransferase